MINLYYIAETKTKIRGYWKSEKKLYRDFIDIYKFGPREVNLYNHFKNILFTQKNQLAIFYVNTILKVAHIIDRAEAVTVLKTKTEIRRAHIKPSFFKTLLKKYNGFTVYKKKDFYLFEIWEA